MKEGRSPTFMASGPIWPKKAARSGTAIRNYQARNFMRSMAVGDQAFSHHSNTKPPAIIRLMEVSETGITDPSQFEQRLLNLIRPPASEAPRLGLPFCLRLILRPLQVPAEALMPAREPFPAPRTHGGRRGKPALDPAGARATAQRLFDLLESGNLDPRPTRRWKLPHAPLVLIGATRGRASKVFARPGAFTPSLRSVPLQPTGSARHCKSRATAELASQSDRSWPFVGPGPCWVCLLEWWSARSVQRRLEFRGALAGALRHPPRRLIFGPRLWRRDAACWRLAAVVAGLCPEISPPAPRPDRRLVSLVLCASGPACR